MPPFWFAAAFAGACVAAAHELGATQPAAYLDSGFGAPRAAASALGALALLIGVLAERRISGSARDRLPLCIAALSLVTTGSAWALHFGFTSPRWFDAIALAVPAIGGLALGATLSAATRALGRPVLALGGVARSLNPFRLASIALLLGLGAAAAAVVGLVRSAAAIGLLLATLSAWSSLLVVFLERRELRRPALARASSGTALVAGFAALIGAEAIVPSTELAEHANTIVFSRRSERARYVVTSGQDALELFTDGRLALSSIDERRYHEALVHPAMLMAARRERVLVLGSGHGATAREVLRHPEVKELVLVVPDLALVELGRRLAWLSRGSGGALDDPRVRAVEGEAVVWLGEHAERFDVAIVDLPDPSTYVDGKHYTRHFYRLLAAHLGEGGVAAVQATSPFGSPLTFAGIASTLQAAGLRTQAYHAPVPTFGDWGFVLASAEAVPSPPPELARWLSGTTLSESFALPADVKPRETPAVSTLHEPVVVETFSEERERLGL